jgi:hypothetical protein
LKAQRLTFLFCTDHPKPIIQANHLTKEYRPSAHNGLVDVSNTIEQSEKAGSSAEVVGWEKRSVPNIETVRWARYASALRPTLPNLQTPETVVIPPGRAEKRLHRAFRRMSNI